MWASRSPFSTDMDLVYGSLPSLWRDFCYGGQYESWCESACIVADDGLWVMKVFPLECVYCVSGGLQSLWTTTGTQSDLGSLLPLISHECLIFSLHLHKTPFDLSQLRGQKRQDVREGGILQYCSVNKVYLSLNKHWNMVNIYPHYSISIQYSISLFLTVTQLLPKLL